MSTFKLTLAYDGTDFVGWQRQATGISIQGLLEDALRELDGRDGRRSPAPAGPTPACMRSARSRAFTLERAIDAATLRARAQRAAARRRPRAVGVEDAGADFHARFDARGEDLPLPHLERRRSCSPFERRYAWHVPDALDVDGDATRRRGCSRARTTSRRFRPPAATRARPSGR